MRPDEDIEDRVSRLYNRIESPVMTDVAIEFDVRRAPRSRRASRSIASIRKRSFDLFAGEQLVMVGRYKQARRGQGRSSAARSAARQQTFDFPAELVEKSSDETYAFVEKLWAVRRIGEIIDEIDLKGKNDELVNELVELSTEHGILTPYTSFLADENDECPRRGGQRRAGRPAAACPQEAFPATRAFRSGSSRGASSGPHQAPAATSARTLRPKPPRTAGPAVCGSQSRRARYRPPVPGGGKCERHGVGAPTWAAEELRTAGQTVRNVGNRTFYCRGGQWVDSTVTEKQQQSTQHVKQFSDEYFELARPNGRTLSQYLVFDEPVLVNLSGKAYLIEP